MKPLIPNELTVLNFIRRYMLHKGRSPSIRELMSKLGYKSPRSAALIVDSLIKKGKLFRKDNSKLVLINDKDNDVTRRETIEIPLVGSIACGMPLLAEENVESVVRISTEFIKPNSNYFLLRATGDSMNKAGIDDGDVVLIKQQTTAEDGDIVVALVDDEATLKEFERIDNAVILKPHSTNENHKPIILDRKFFIQGILTQVIGKW